MSGEERQREREREGDVSVLCALHNEINEEQKAIVLIDMNLEL
jgi:hypothetical protein